MSLMAAGRVKAKDMVMAKAKKNIAELRSRKWFNNPDDPEMTALYTERYLNYGLTPEELRDGKPIIGIAQTGSDLSPCNRHHIELAKRVRDGIIAAGGVPLEIPVHPIQESGKRPTAMLDRNLAYLSLVESLYGYPIDGVVLTIGCDKTTPALLMAAATVDIPAIALSVGPMLNGWHEGERTGSGTILWKARELMAAGEIDGDGFLDLAMSAVPSVGYCNTMGTASTMNSLAEILGMQLPGSAAIPAAYRQRGQISYRTGERIVEMVWEDLCPSDIMTKQAFENAIVANSAIGGSTNAPIHINAIARHLGIEITNDEWQRLGHHVPLLLNLQPAGTYLGEDYYRAGGVPAVIAELMRHDLIPHPEALTVNGKSLGENCKEAKIAIADVIKTVDAPMKEASGFLNLTGNLFDSAIMKTSVISDDFAQRYLQNPDDPNAFEGTAFVFESVEDFHARIDDESLAMDETAILVMRGAGPIGYPGGAEVVNMRPPAYLIKKGITTLACIGDGRQSGTSASPSILNASPEAADGGGLALIQTGDRVRVDLNKGTANMLVSDTELQSRAEALAAAGGFPRPDSQTPWQDIFRQTVAPFSDGMVIKDAPDYRSIHKTKGLPRDNH